MLIPYSSSKIRWTINFPRYPMQYFQNALTALATAVSYACQMLMKFIPLVIYLFSPCKISWEIYFLHYPMQCFQTVLASFAMTVSYMFKMFKELIPMFNFMLIFHSSSK